MTNENVSVSVHESMARFRASLLRRASAVAWVVLIIVGYQAVRVTVDEDGRNDLLLSQGGQPIDVAEAIAWYANPGSSAISGNVVRVCGQALIGA